MSDIYPANTRYKLEPHAAPRAWPPGLSLGGAPRPWPRPPAQKLHHAAADDDDDDQPGCCSPGMAGWLTGWLGEDKGGEGGGRVLGHGGQWWRQE